MNLPSGVDRGDPKKLCYAIAKSDNSTHIILIQYNVEEQSKTSIANYLVLMTFKIISKTHDTVYINMLQGNICCFKLEFQISMNVKAHHAKTMEPAKTWLTDIVAPVCADSTANFAR